MNIYKNKKNLLVLMGLFSFSMQQSIDASQYSKKAGMSLIAAAKILATDRSAMQTVYPENDTHNHNIMNGTYFDTRPFVNRAEKRNFIEHHFKAMNVVKDMTETCINFLAGSKYSRQQLTEFMSIAEKAAYDEKSDVVKLKHLERAFAEIKYGLSEYEYSDHDNQTAHHEAGHAVMTVVQDVGYDIVWVSIQSYKETFGYVLSIPNTSNKTDAQRLNSINMCLAGGVTEQFFGLPEKFGFETYKKTLNDFLSRGVSEDFSFAIEQVKILVLNKSEIDRNNCFLLVSKAFGKDLNVADDFMKIYEKCTKTHFHKNSIDAKAKDMIKTQYIATIQLVGKYQKEIEAVVQELLREKVVSGKRIKEIIDEVQLNNKK